MPLEAIMIAVDNSEYTRNGDYTPTRFLAQNEAVGYVANAKMQENLESSVGLMTMAGSRINVACSPGREPGQILNALARDVRIGGTCNFLAALKTAQLALKNRANKNQRQRIIMFVASPIEVSAEELVKQGKIFKKNNIAIDIINFGSENMTNTNTEKLEQLVQAVNTSDNSHLVSIPPGPHIFADLVLTSAIMSSDASAVAAVGASGAGAAASGAASHPGGVDPNLDPEMAMVLRMSMEEERARQQRAAATSGDASATSVPAAATAAAGGAPMEEDEEALLAQAIAMSLQQNQEDAEMPDANAPPAAATTATTAPAASPAAPAPAGAPADDAAMVDLAMQDPDFLNSLLSGVPGAGGDQIDNLLDQLTNPNQNAPASGSNNDAKKDDKKDADKK